jgi:hypothetical protein
MPPRHGLPLTAVMEPLAARRPHLELSIRWMHKICRFKPSTTTSRRFSVTAGFSPTCAIDGAGEHSPAEHARRPAVPAESTTLGFTRLQSGAVLAAAGQAPGPCGVALAAMRGLPGLRIFEATGATSTGLGGEHGHRVLRGCGTSTTIVLVPLPGALSTGQWASGTGVRSCSPAAAPEKAGTRPPAADAGSPQRRHPGRQGARALVGHCHTHRASRSNTDGEGLRCRTGGSAKMIPIVAGDRRF